MSSLPPSLPPMLVVSVTPPPWMKGQGSVGAIFFACFPFSFIVGRGHHSTLSSAPPPRDPHLHDSALEKTWRQSYRKTWAWCILLGLELIDRSPAPMAAPDPGQFFFWTRLWLEIFQLHLCKDYGSYSEATEAGDDVYSPPFECDCVLSAPFNFDLLFFYRKFVSTYVLHH